MSHTLAIIITILILADFSGCQTNGHILALTEGRGEARCEVGMAVIDLSISSLILCQISDTQSYINTLTKINILNPTEIVIPATFASESGHQNRLIDMVRRQFPSVTITSVARKTFNKTNGMERIQQLCIPALKTICIGLQYRYYALSAASALLTYVQNGLNVYYASDSIKVAYQESEGFAIIDVSTADRLELVSSTRPAQANRYSSLYGILNHTYTKIGARSLRSTILQPPCTVAFIQERLDCVSELIKSPEKLSSIQVLLQKISNIEQLLTISTIIPTQAQSCSARQLNYILLLNKFVDIIVPLSDILGNCQQPFFQQMKVVLNDDGFIAIKTLIRKTIYDSAHPAQGEDGIVQRCFAIKPDVNGLLDLVRKTYSERLNDMREYVKHVGNKYNLPLSLQNNNTKGYHIGLSLTNQQKRLMKKSDLPPEFIQVYRLAGSFTMKTPELINYSTRIEGIMMEILKVSNIIIHKMLIEIKQYIGLFYQVCENIAKLDVLQSLAQASLTSGYVRPKFGTFTDLTHSIHPLLEFLCPNRPVANSVSICKNYNFQIVTGPNGSGKSIYIRQIMLLQVMAQVGCYVPAKSAIFKPVDRMFARIYLEDDMECGASAFMLEIKEIKYMLTTMTDNSLFIIDELCRSTSLEEGTALAMAICEKLTNTSAFVFITTHFTLLTKLYDLYLNVKVWQMETIATGDNNSPNEMCLNFKHNVLPGVTQLQRYGIYLVRDIWPDLVVKRAYALLNQMSETTPKNNGDFRKLNDIIRLKYKLESDLDKLKCEKLLTQAEINKHLNCYQNDLQRRFGIALDLSLLNNHLYNKKVLETLNDNNDHHNEMDSINKCIQENFTPQSSQNITIAADDDDDDEQHDSLLLMNTSNNNDNNNSSSALLNLSNIDYLVPEIKLDILNNSVLLNQQLNVTAVSATATDTEQQHYSLDNIDKDVSSILEDLESCSDAFFEDDEYFESLTQNTNKSICFNTSEHQDYVSPVVHVIEGPYLPSSSSFNSEEQHQIDDENLSIGFIPDNKQHNKTEIIPNNNDISISYSPLHSPIPLQLISSSSEMSNSLIKNSILDVPAKLLETMNVIALNENTTSSSSSNKKRNNAMFVTTNTDDSTSKDNVPLQTTATVTTDEGSGSKSSMKESDYVVNDNKNKKILKRKVQSNKYVPPRKLTKRQIQDEFNKQDRIIYERSNMTPNQSEDLLKQLLNRPSIKQIQHVKHVALLRKTTEGVVEVIPAEPELFRKRQGRKFLGTRLSSFTSSFDMSIFSDRNAKPFEAFLNSNVKDYNMFNFHLNSSKTSPIRTQQAGTTTGSDKMFCFNPGCSKDDDDVNDEVQRYYTQNQNDIDDIVSKYLLEKTVSFSSVTSTSNTDIINFT